MKTAWPASRFGSRERGPVAHLSVRVPTDPANVHSRAMDALKDRTLRGNFGLSGPAGIVTAEARASYAPCGCEVRRTPSERR